jgi:ribosomal protein S19E (S16A)
MRPYRINPKYIEILRKTLDDLKRAGIIEESISAWAAPSSSNSC